jgi:alkylation response protein AidB-like acyl-CoA dehydrogenase
VLVQEQIARCCPNTAIMIGAGDGAPCRAILHHGSEAQKKRYLPGFVTGEWRAAWGMSEPNAGSDIGGMQTRAVAKGDHYVINGSKVWCTMAQIANVFLVFTRMSEAPGLAGVGALLLEAPTRGFRIGKHLDLIGLRGTGMAELIFEDCEVPTENVLIAAGHMRDLLTVFNIDRIATNPPICLGAASAAFDIAVQHLSDRKQYGRPLADFQGLQWKIADMAMDLAAGRTLLYDTAARFDRGSGRSLDSSIAKTYVNEMSVRVTNTAIQLLGAYGLSSEFPLEQLYRDVRGLSIGYGTTEVQRNLIARDIFDGLR